VFEFAADLFEFVQLFSQFGFLLFGFCAADLFNQIGFGLEKAGPLACDGGAGGGRLTAEKWDGDLGMVEGLVQLARFGELFLAIEFPFLCEEF